MPNYKGLQCPCRLHHYNPVKHGLAKAPKDWEYSSFSRYVKDGIYDREWGAGHEIAFDEAIGNE